MNLLEENTELLKSEMEMLIVLIINACNVPLSEGCSTLESNVAYEGKTRTIQKLMPCQIALLMRLKSLNPKWLLPNSSIAFSEPVCSQMQQIYSRGH